MGHFPLYWPIGLVCHKIIFDCRLNCNNSYLQENPVGVPFGRWQTGIVLKSRNRSNELIEEFSHNIDWQCKRKHNAFTSRENETVAIAKAHDADRKDFHVPSLNSAITPFAILDPCENLYCKGNLVVVVEHGTAIAEIIDLKNINTKEFSHRWRQRQRQHHKLRILLVEQGTISVPHARHALKKHFLPSSAK